MYRQIVAALPKQNPRLQVPEYDSSNLWLLNRPIGNEQFRRSQQAHNHDFKINNIRCTKNTPFNQPEQESRMNKVHISYINKHVVTNIFENTDLKISHRVNNTPMKTLRHQSKQKTANKRRAQAKMRRSATNWTKWVNIR